MPEPLLILDRAPRAETPFFLRNTLAGSICGHAKSDHFLAIDKTRAHPAHTYTNRFVSVHDLFLLTSMWH